MKIDWAMIATNSWKVLSVGMILGAGLPFLFSVGITMWDRGEGGVHADGSVSRRKPVELAIAYTLFAFMGACVVVGLIYLMRKSISHYLGVEIF